jgi:large subunit ribosomal protein L21
MYAIVEIAGHQYKVEQDQFIYTHKLNVEAGEAITFDKVLLVVNGTTRVGAPTVEGATVTGKVLEHVKGDKIIVFKKKRRKGYQKSNGHRQHYSKVLIEGIAG